MKGGVTSTDVIDQIRNMLISKNYEVGDIKGVQHRTVTFTNGDRSFYLFDHFSHIKLIVFSHTDLEYTKKYISFDEIIKYIEKVIN